MSQQAEGAGVAVEDFWTSDAREDEMQEEKRQDGQVQRNVVVDVVLD